MRIFFAALLLSVVFFSCNTITGSGRIVTEKRSVENFTEIETAGSISIEVTHGDKIMVEVEADDNVLSHILTEVRNGKLSVMFEEGSYTNVEAKVYVTIPSVKRLLVSGSGDITSKDTLANMQQIVVEVNGSGSIEAVLDAPEVKAEINGSGSIVLRGRTKKLSVDNSGSGSLDASRLLSETAIVKNSGSGSSHIFASLSLEADMDGSGDIIYDGNPPNKKIDDGGSGSINPGKQ